MKSYVESIEALVIANGSMLTTKKKILNRIKRGMRMGIVNEEEMTKLVAITEMSIYEIENAFANIVRATDEFTKRLTALEVAMRSNNWRKMHGYPKRRRAKNE